MSNIRRKQSGQFEIDRPKSIQPRSFELNHLSIRLAGVWIVLGLVSVGLVVRLFWLQILNAPTLQSKAQQQQSVSKRPLVPRRTIVDRSNNQIAIDRPSYTIYAHPSQFSEVIITKGVRRNKTKKVAITPLDMAQRIRCRSIS